MKLFITIFVLVIVSIGGSIFLGDKLRYEEAQQSQEQQYEQEILRQKALHTGSALPKTIDEIDHTVLDTENSEKVITVQEYTEEECD